MTDGVTEAGADMTAEDVRDDETTRTGDGVPAPRTSSGLPQRAPRGGDGARSAGDATVEDLLGRLAAAERARDAAEQRADALAAALDDARSRPAETFGMRADKVLRMAEHEAAQRRRAAEADAAGVLDAARAEADRIVADARGEVDRLRAAGVTARRDSELVADTAASMHAHVSALRGSVREEIARRHALLGTELGRLDAPVARTRAPRPEDPRAPRPDADTDRVPRPAAGPAHALRGDGAAPREDARPAGTGPDGTDTGPAPLPVVSLPEQRDTEPDPDGAAPAGDDGARTS